MSSPWEDFGPWTDFEEKPEVQVPVAVAPELDIPQDIERRMALREQLGYPETEPRATPWEGFKAELQERVGDPAREFLRTIVSAPLKAFGALASDQTQMEVDPYSGAIIPKQIQPPVLIPPEQQPLYKVGAGTEQFFEQVFPPSEEPELARQVAGGAGQVGAMMLGGGAARALGAGVAGTAATATALGAASEFDDAFTRARRRGDDPDTALAKSLGYATVAALIENKLGAGRILRQLMPSASAAVQRLTAMGVSKKILGNFIAGGVEEAGQRFAQNWIVEGKPSAEGVMEEAVPGAIIQGVFGLPGAATVAPSIEKGGVPSAVQRETETVLRDVLEPEITQEGQVQVPVSEGRPQAAEARVTKFSEDLFNPDVPISNTQTTQVGMAVKNMTDLNDLMKAQEKISVQQKQVLEKLKSGPLDAQGMRDFLIASRVQYPRETIEVATNSGSWTERPAAETSLGTQLGERPLDWRKNPEVRQWLINNAEKLWTGDPLKQNLAELKTSPARKTELAAEIQPAVRIGGRVISDPNKGHIQMALEVGGPEAISEVSKPANQGFVYKGEFISREATSKLLGEETPMTSERLKEIRAEKPKGGEPIEEAQRKEEVLTPQPVQATAETAQKQKPSSEMSPGEVLAAAREQEPMEVLRQHYQDIREAYRNKKPINFEAAKRYEPEVEGYKNLGEWLYDHDYRANQATGNWEYFGPEQIAEAAKKYPVIPFKPKPKKGVGMFPRVSETLGLGEPALPPTVETVRSQRELEARTAVLPAPGEKTTPSRGVWFGGNNPRETSDMMQSRANAFLQGKTDEQAIVDIARAAAGDRAVQLDNQAANFAIKDLLVRIHAKIQSAKANPVYQQQAWAQIDRLAELSRRLGSEDARSLVSRQLAYRQIDWMMPLLSWRGIIQDKWRNALGLQPNDSIEGLDTEENAKKFNLPQLNGFEAKKLAELSERAQNEPQGVRRNKTLEEMVKILQSDSRISKLDLLRDAWYGSVLMRVGTMVNVLAGSYATGASFAAVAALDRIARLHPIQAMQILGQFIGGTIEGTLIADQIARKGAYHLLPDAEQRMVNLLTGKAGARFDNLEELLRRGNPVGVLAYTRRFMAALDYIGALGTRDSQVLYAALTRGDQESLDALEKRFDRDVNKRAEQQARSEMGPKASRAEVLVRKREILEEGVNSELKDAAVQTARRAAQNADPRGIPGWLYRTSSKLPFFARAPLGLAFMRSAMNMVQNAVDYTPVIGTVSAARGEIESRLPPTNPLRKMGIGLDIPIEERRMMWVAQATSFGIAAIAASLFLGDDEEDDGMEISGSWRGISPQRKSQLMELGERPNSIRFGKNGPWISFKQMPWAPPLAMIGTMRDEERFHAKDWDGESAMSKIVSGWLGGLLYVRDISSLSGIAGLFDMNAWSTQEKPTELTQKSSKLASQSAGRFATGYIPSILKEIDEFSDPTLYRPSKDELAGWWIRNVPYARRTVGPGPALNNFGEPIQVTPPPIKSWIGFGKDTDLYNTLGQLASRGIFLPEPGRTAKIVDDDAVYREMTEDEWYKFIKERGPILKDNFNEGRLRWLRESEDRDVIKWLSDTGEEVSKLARLRLFPMTKIERLRRETIK